MDIANSFPLVIAILGMLGPAPVRADRPPAFDIQIHLQVERSIAPKVLLAELEEEAEQIWLPYGVHLCWRDTRSADEPFPLTAVLGSDFERYSAPSGPLVLGRAVIESNRTPTRPIRISFRATEQTLALRQHAWASIGSGQYRRELSRALGRVLAHEIGHVLLANRAHEPTGLMRAFFTPEDLGSADRSFFVLTANSLGRLRSRLEQLSVRQGPVSPINPSIDSEEEKSLR